jgi:hypothetical protein
MVKTIIQAVSLKKDAPVGALPAGDPPVRAHKYLSGSGPLSKHGAQGLLQQPGVLRAGHRFAVEGGHRHQAH